MANNKAIQILRGSRDYDPSEINNELLDGQPFYSKKNELIYIGDKSKVAEKDENGNPTSYITKPAGAAWIKPGEGKGSFVSACLEDVNSSSYMANQLPEASGHESIAFGKENIASGDRSTVFGVDNKGQGDRSITTGQLNINNGNDSFITGLDNNNNSLSSIIAGTNNNYIYGSNSIIGGLENKYNTGANSIIAGLKNTYIKGSNSIILGSENNIGLQEGITSDNNIISGYNNTVIQSYNIVNGEENYITADNNIISGYNNESIRNYSYLLGSNLQSTENDYKTAVGYYNADLPNSLFEIGNGNNSSGKNAFSVNKYGDAFLLRCLIIGQESRDPEDDPFSSSKLAIVDSDNTILNITSNSITASLGDGYYRFNMWDPATSPNLIDFTLDHVNSSDYGFVIARSGLDLNTKRYLDLGSKSGLDYVNIGEQVPTIYLGHSGYTSIDQYGFKTFGINSNFNSSESLLLGNDSTYKNINTITLNATSSTNFNINNLDAFNINTNEVKSNKPFVAKSSITSGGSVSVGNNLLLNTDGFIKFKKYNKSTSLYDYKCDINYDDIKSYLNISCDTNVVGALKVNKTIKAKTTAGTWENGILGTSNSFGFQLNEHNVAASSTYSNWIRLKSDVGTLAIGSYTQGVTHSLEFCYMPNDGDNDDVIHMAWDPSDNSLTCGIFRATSDKRLKENITLYECKKSILDLPIYEFDYKNSKGHTIGCMAQDLQEICPEIVSEDRDGFLRIEESKLIYLLLQEVKALKNSIGLRNI